MSFTKTKLINSYPDLGEWIGNMNENVIKEFNYKQLKKGDVLFWEGERCESLYVICSGKFIISSLNHMGDEKGIVLVEKNFSLGEMETVLGVPYYVFTARALADASLISIPQKSYGEIMMNDPVFSKKLMEVFASKLFAAANSTIDHSQFKSFDRLIKLILQNGPGLLKETKAELARTCGVSERTIYRGMHQLRDYDLIDIHKGKIFVTEEQITALKKRLD